MYDPCQTKENNNVKPSADVVWLIEHTRKNDKGDLEWADTTRSKTIHVCVQFVNKCHCFSIMHMTFCFSKLK